MHYLKQLLYWLAHEFRQQIFQKINLIFQGWLKVLKYS